MEKTEKRPRCHNCKYGGDQFKVVGKTHLHCEHPKYTDEDFMDGTISAWDTLMEFSDTCSDHNFKPKK